MTEENEIVQGREESSSGEDKDIYGCVKKAIKTREGETPREFYERVVSVCNAQIELLAAYDAAYDEEKKRERYRETHNDAMLVVARGSLSAGQRILRHVLDFAEEVRQYETKHPEYSSRESVQEKRNILESLLH